MRYTNHRTASRLWALLAVLMLLLAACGPAAANSTPTLSVEAIYTSAFETLSAQYATQLASTPPTDTPAPSPTILPTLPPLPTPLATFAAATPITNGGGGACDSAAYVADVTIPDGTTIDPGKKFTKTWSLLNNGTCTWGSGYQLEFDSGDQLSGGSSSVSLSVAPGAVANISVNLVAPTTNGKFTGTWRMHNASGQAFGSFITVVIKVGAGSTATAGPSPTGAPAGTVTVSGHLGVVDATINFSNATSTPTVTYVAGTDSYSFNVPSGWSGTITPTKGKAGKWIFSPINQTFTNLTSSRTQNFTATQGATATP